MRIVALLLSLIALNQPFFAEAKSFSGEMFADDKKVARLSKHVSVETRKTTVEIKVFSTTGELTSERRLVMKENSLHFASMSNHENQEIVEAKFDGTTIKTTVNGKKSEAIEVTGNVFDFDLIAHAIRSKQDELGTGEGIEFQILFLPLRKTKNIEIKKKGESRFQGVKTVAFSMLPSSIWMKMIAKVMSLVPTVHLEPVSYELIGLDGPLIGAPGARTEDGPPKFGVTVWRPTSIQKP